MLTMQKWTAFVYLDQLLTTKDPAGKKHDRDWHLAEQGRKSLDRSLNVMMCLSTKQSQNCPRLFSSSSYILRVDNKKERQEKYLCIWPEKTLKRYMHGKENKQMDP